MAKIYLIIGLLLLGVALFGCVDNRPRLCKEVNGQNICAPAHYNSNATGADCGVNPNGNFSCLIDKDGNMTCYGESNLSRRPVCSNATGEFICKIETDCVFGEKYLEWD